MAKYKYYWDTDAKKKRYGGKYFGQILDGSGYFGTNSAGDKQHFTPKDAGDRRKFIGSPMQEFTFSDNIHGTHTIVAESYEEALRVAKSMGFTADDYRKRRGK